MKKLLVRCFIFSFPLVVCLTFFIADDPFGIFYKNASLAEASDDVMKTRKYLHKWKDAGYTAFIFGNSRANAFKINDWQKYVGPQAFFNFCAPGESVLNIRKKLELILSHQNIKYALILIDIGILENTDNKHYFYKGPVYNHSPITSDISYVNFYGNYVRYYFDDLFFMKHIYYRLTSSYKKNWMENSFKDPAEQNKKLRSTNFETLADSLLETNFIAYKNTFHPNYSPVGRKLKVMNAEDSLHLVKIRDLLEMNSVNYKIIIPPDFQGAKIAPRIYTTLHSIMRKNLYDFTGLNKISSDSTLNYENLHFTARAGAKMLDSLYAQK